LIRSKLVEIVVTAKKAWEIQQGRDTWGTRILEALPDLIREANELGGLDYRTLGTRLGLRPAGIDELMLTGLTQQYLEGLSQDQYMYLYKAKQALADGDMILAQQCFDMLSNVKIMIGEKGFIDPVYAPTGEYGKKTYFQRSNQDFVTAEQQLKAHYGARTEKEKLSKKVQKEIAEKLVKSPAFREEDIKEAEAKGKFGAATGQEGTFKQYKKKHHLTRYEILAIRFYTSEAFKVSNATLHDIRVDDPNFRVNFETTSGLTRLAESGLEKLPKFLGTTYRGDVAFGDVLKVRKTGNDFYTLSPWSSAGKPKSAFPGNIGWVIRLTGKSAADISALSTKGDLEAEVLIPSHVRFKVVNVYTWRKFFGNPKNPKNWAAENAGEIPAEVQNFIKEGREREYVIEVQEQ
jgi:hypothetical protein